MDLLGALFNKEKMDELMGSIDGISSSAENIGQALNGIIEVVKITNGLLIVLILAIIIHAVITWKKK